MAEARSKSTVELDDDLAFHLRQWRVERVGWWALLAFIALAALGLFGSGVLSHATAATPDAWMRIEYERFARRQAASSLKFRFAPQAVSAGKLQFWVEQDYLESLGVVSITPEPSSVEIRGNRLLYTFDVSDSASGPVITFDLQPEGMGKSDGVAGLPNGDEVRFWQMVYP